MLFLIQIVQFIQITKYNFLEAHLWWPTNWNRWARVMTVPGSRARKFLPCYFIGVRPSEGEGLLFAGWTFVTWMELGKLHSSTSNSPVRSQSKQWRSMTKSCLNPFPWESNSTASCLTSTSGPWMWTFWHLFLKGQSIGWWPKEEREGIKMAECAIKWFDIPNGIFQSWPLKDRL